MANSRICGAEHGSGAQFGKTPPRSPGALGYNDAADPNACAKSIGDTPGSLGSNDAAVPSTSVEVVVRQNRDTPKTTADGTVRVTPILAQLEKRDPAKPADVYYLYTHVRIDFTINNPDYLTAIETYGESDTQKAGIPRTIDMFAEFGPNGGAIVNVVTTLLGIPVDGQVVIGRSMGSQDTPTWQKVIFGRGYESNRATDESVFPDLRRAPREFWDAVVNDKKLTLDANMGDRIYKRAMRIQKLADESRYLYLVYDKLGPILGSRVMGAYHRNCWGFVADVLDENFPLQD